MSIDSTLQNVGTYYTWISLFFAFVLLLGCVAGIILIWALNWEPTDASGKKLNPDEGNKTKIIITVILSISIIAIPVFSYIIYHFRKNKSFQEGMGLTGTIGTISDAFKSF